MPITAIMNMVNVIAKHEGIISFSLCRKGRRRDYILIIYKVD